MDAQLLREFSLGPAAPLPAGRNSILRFHRGQVSTSTPASLHDIAEKAICESLCATLILECPPAASRLQTLAGELATSCLGFALGGYLVEDALVTNGSLAIREGRTASWDRSK